MSATNYCDQCGEQHEPQDECPCLSHRWTLLSDAEKVEKMQNLINSLFDRDPPYAIKFPDRTIVMIGHSDLPIVVDQGREMSAKELEKTLSSTFYQLIERKRLEEEGN